ncbi:MAG: hypothetical protein ACLFUV_06685 [Methanomassiliicoccales archaeon]
MAICELDSDEALCKEKKTRLVRVHLDSVEGLEDLAEYDLVVDRDTARETVEDWEQFLKSNRVKEDQDPIFLDKLKRKKDHEALLPHSRRRYTGWIDLEGVPEDRRQEALDRRKDEDVLNAWDMLSFDEMRDTCAECPLSWDKGRGCIGTFGPEKSLLPSIAERHGCEIVSSVFAHAENGELLSPEDAETLLDEVKVLRERLPDEGRQMVQRYGGVVDRLEKMGQTCVDFQTRFYFL